ncbi:MAG TPA: hypothetical protein VJU84_17425 [Pyrinomonadaceae bacterium]|nr:hypothetical protein [Pyrinomonadaceae bacterium]
MKTTRRKSTRRRKQTTSIAANKKAKKTPITFGDMYGLGLLVKNPERLYDLDIIAHLSPEAQKIAKAVVSPRRSTPKDVKSAAKELSSLAK